MTAYPEKNLWFTLALLVCALLILSGCAHPVAWYFSEESALPITEDGYWKKTGEPYAVLPVKYVMAMPPQCNYPEVAGCATRYHATKTCQVWIDVHYTPDQKAKALRHEVEGHCAGFSHNRGV